MVEEHLGGCLCGRVRFKAVGRPQRVGVCHCMDCRRHHGAMFYAAAIFDAHSVTIAGPTHAYKGRCFCPNCGSSVFAFIGEEIELHLGALDQPEKFRPTYECWVARRASWVPRFSDTVTYAKDCDAN